MSQNIGNGTKFCHPFFSGPTELSSKTTLVKLMTKIKINKKFTLSYERISRL